MNSDGTRKFDDLIEEFDTAMLITHALDGRLRARPMAIAEHEPGGLLVFATRPEDEKLEEILRDPRVAVTLQGDGRYLSITGRARIDTDLTRAAEAWSPAMKLWFPEGAGDPDLTLILVAPETGEYWDRSGLLRLQFLWEAGKALVRGEQLDDEELSGHAKVAL